MPALLPLLAAAAPAAVTAFAVGAARGAGGEVGKAAGQGITSIAGDIKNTITSFGQPQGSGQQQFVSTAGGQKMVYVNGQPYLVN